VFDRVCHVDLWSSGLVFKQMHISVLNAALPATCALTFGVEGKLSATLVNMQQVCMLLLLTQMAQSDVMTFVDAEGADLLRACLKPRCSFVLCLNLLSPDACVSDGLQ
jgi:hypothetical protein